jgi:hypothetical protein
MALPEMPEMPEMPVDLELIPDLAGAPDVLGTAGDLAGDVAGKLAGDMPSGVADLAADAAANLGDPLGAAGAAITGGAAGAAGVAADSAGKVLSGAAGIAGAAAGAAGVAGAAAIKKPKAGGPAANKGPGRFTPKGSAPVKSGAKARNSSGENLPAYASSGRYTAKAEKSAAEEAAYLPTRPWIPWLMFALLAIGGLLIVLNYVGVWPNSPSNWYLLAGIVAITGGFITATQLR